VSLNCKQVCSSVCFSRLSTVIFLLKSCYCERILSLSIYTCTWTFLSFCAASLSLSACFLMVDLSSLICDYFSASSSSMVSIFLDLVVSSSSIVFLLFFISLMFSRQWLRSLSSFSRIFRSSSHYTMMPCFSSSSCDILRLADLSWLAFSSSLLLEILV
jgi:hypothetical protein